MQGCLTSRIDQGGVYNGPVSSRRSLPSSLRSSPAGAPPRATYIAIEGPIGVGKTALVARLAEHLSARVSLEQGEENPFLSSFYKDRSKFAFQTQLFFLLSRYRQQEELWQPDLFSRYLFTDYIFVRDRLFAVLNLSDHELKLYDQVYRILNTRVLKPDLVVYLQARLDVLIDRIKRRGRTYEKNFDSHYLKRVSESFNDYFFHYADSPLLVVDTSDIDFVDSNDDFLELTRAILKHRGGMQFYRPLRK